MLAVIPEKRRLGSPDWKVSPGTGHCSLPWEGGFSRRGGDQVMDDVEEQRTPGKSPSYLVAPTGWFVVMGRKFSYLKLKE